MKTQTMFNVTTSIIKVILIVGIVGIRGEIQQLVKRNKKIEEKISEFNRMKSNICNLETGHEYITRRLQWSSILIKDPDDKFRGRNYITYNPKEHIDAIAKYLGAEFVNTTPIESEVKVVKKKTVKRKDKK